jgi:hypothetical protein
MSIPVDDARRRLEVQNSQIDNEIDSVRGAVQVLSKSLDDLKVHLYSKFGKVFLII